MSHAKYLAREGPGSGYGCHLLEVSLSSVVVLEFHLLVTHSVLFIVKHTSARVRTYTSYAYAYMDVQ